MTTITVYTLESGVIAGYEAGGHAGGKELVEETLKMLLGLNSEK